MTEAQVREALSDEVLVRAGCAEDRIKNAAIREGGFGPTTQADAEAFKRDFYYPHGAWCGWTGGVNEVRRVSLKAKLEYD